MKLAGLNEQESLPLKTCGISQAKENRERKSTCRRAKTNLGDKMEKVRGIRWKKYGEAGVRRGGGTPLGVATPRERKGE